MRQVRLSAKALSSERPKIDVDMDTAAATSKAQRLKAMLRSIPNKIRTRINIDVDTNKISLLKSSLLSLAPSAIPILATLIPAIMAIGNALAVVGVVQ